MSKILYIKANAKPEGTSRTFKISDKFIDKYKELNPNDEVITLDLYKENIGFLTEEAVCTHGISKGECKDDPILKYAYQFAEADKYLIAAPFWNLSFPAILKAYIDYVSVTGITFKYTSAGPVGLCQGKKAVYVVARGGGYSEGPAAAYEMGERYLKTIFAFFGITDFTTISADKLDSGNNVDAILEKSFEEAKEMAIVF